MRKIFRYWPLLASVLLLATAGCAGRPAAEPLPLTVSAAASLTDALNELIALYQEKNPSVKITPNYAGSGALQRQIEEGAPADLFISAAPRHMDALQEKGLLLEGTRIDLLGNTMVLIAREELQGVDSFADLPADSVRKIALGEPDSVPAGRYAKETLTYQGLWDKLQPKYVFGKDVRQVLTWVEGGDADVGLVYLTDAKLAPTIPVVATAPEGSHAPILYPAAVIKDSLAAAAAEDFLTFLSGAEAATVFERYGFTVLAR